MRIAVILVNYNGLIYNDNCIASILQSECEEQLHIYVVDNGSTDGSMEVLEKMQGGEPRLSLVYMGKNEGFSAANNVGIKKAMEDGTDYILLLNNDTVIEKEMISELVNAQKRYAGCCMTVPKIYYYDKPDTIWSAGGGFTKIVKKPVSYGENQPDKNEYNVEKKCENANGCCILLSAEVIKRMGLLNEDFFLYYEDTEYFMRAEEKDISIIYVPSARMYHKVNGSTKGNDNVACVYYITRNWLMCHKLHLSKARYPVFWIYFMMNRLAWIGIWLLNRKYLQVKAVYEGIRDFYLRKTGKYVG